MVTTDEVLEPTTPDDPEAPRLKAEPIESRFLFVDVAAMRAKQLRRGASPRLGEDVEGDTAQLTPLKAERVAMEEVRRGLVLYDVSGTDEPAAAGE